MKYSCGSKSTFRNDFSGEKIKIEARYWAIIRRSTLYPLTTENKLNILTYKGIGFLLFLLEISNKSIAILTPKIDL
jgi:hypothetical protein